MEERDKLILTILLISSTTPIPLSPCLKKKIRDGADFWKATFHRKSKMQENNGDKDEREWCIMP